MNYLLHHLLQASAARDHSQEAIVAGSERRTYGEAATACTALASGLRSAGLRRGGRVGVLLEAGIDQAISIFAASEAGGVFVPIHVGLFPDQVGHIIADCGMSVLITVRERLTSLIEADVDLTPLSSIVMCDGSAAAFSAALPAVDLDEVAAHTASSLTDVAIGRDLAGLMYTSGSTGRPKGVMISHEQVLAGSAIVSDYLGIRSDDRILGVLPFSFDAGLNQLITAFDQGATILPMSFTFGREIVNAIESERVTALAGVPTLWHLLVHPRSGLVQSDMSSLRYITNTGGHMPASILEQLRQALPHTQIFLMYGLTEAFRSTYLDPAELDRRPDSMGKAIPNTEILVLRPDGTRCDPGEVGELVHRGPTVSLGYWGRPDLTAQRLRTLDDGENSPTAQELVCFSGDLVRTDDEGFLYFVGRGDAMIKTSGYRVSPTEVESVALSHDAVSAAAAVGASDDALGQTIVLFVVAAPSADVVEAEIIAHVAAHRPPHMVPRSVRVVSSLPQTSTGKVNYPELKARAEETS
ncbi:MAG: acyl-CoA ligase (AMP-forming), exosortase A system-associated [Ilumatobacteraceae bacterium]|nr:acyl-CoA ligase (AMP-forming), exosortase A system-associated [Ilumatobacteraceae bacterium]